MARFLRCAAFLALLAPFVLSGCQEEESVLNPQDNRQEEVDKPGAEASPSTWPMSLSDFRFPFLGYQDDYHRGEIWTITCSYGCNLHWHDRWPGAAFHSVDLINNDPPNSTLNRMVLAPARGVVVFSGEKTGYGWCVEIDHDAGHTGRGYKSIVAHLNCNPQRFVSVGHDVLRGTLIGRAGKSGGNWPEHIHFSVWQNNWSVPLDGISGGATIVQNGRYRSGNAVVRAPTGLWNCGS